MKKKYIDGEYISFLCSQMKLMLKSGISIGEALPMIAEDEGNNKTELSEVIDVLVEKTGEGYSLSEAFLAAEKFPSHVTDMIRLGEETGYLEEVFEQLTNYYDRDVRVKAHFKRALMYPLMLGFMMLCVVGILIVKVMPIFKSVYDQIGGSMKGPALFFLNIGVFLGNHLIAFSVIIVAIILILGFIIYMDIKKGKSILPLVRRLRFKAGAARFASALSMGISSGLGAEEAIDMASEMDYEKNVKERILKVKAALSTGENFSDIMAETGFFSGLYCRMLAMGYKAGSIDSVMKEISDRMDDSLSEEIDSLVGKIEPTIVISLSIITGLILLSVMLPLMNIMAAIG